MKSNHVKTASFNSLEIKRRYASYRGHAINSSYFPWFNKYVVQFYRIKDGSRLVTWNTESFDNHVDGIQWVYNYVDKRGGGL